MKTTFISFNHRLIYYGLCTIVTMDTNLILTSTADSGFVSNFELRYSIELYPGLNTGLIA